MNDPRDQTTEPMVDCPRCGGSGFSGHDTGYGDVCSECGGQRQMPARFYDGDSMSAEQNPTTDPPLINRGAWFVLLKLGIGIAGIGIYMTVWRMMS